jgi:hypothetical protein
MVLSFQIPSVGKYRVPSSAGSIEDVGIRVDDDESTPDDGYRNDQSPEPQ